MKRLITLSLVFIVGTGQVTAADLELKNFALSKKEKKEMMRIKRIKEMFLKRFPGWFESSEDVPFMNYQLEERIETRKKAYLREQRKIHRKEQQAKLEKEMAEREKVEAERQKKVEAFKQTPLGAALDLLKQKRYEEAYEKFYALFMEDTSNARINFYLGLSAAGAAMYEEAVSAFERVLIVEPKHTRARLELARALFFLKLFDLSEAEFNKVLETGELPEDVVRNVEKFLTAIEGTRIRNHYAPVVMVGMQYDSNINNDVGENTYVIDTDLIQVTGEKEKSDMVHQEMASMNHIYDFGTLGDFFMQNSATVFAQNYTGNDEKNILFASVSTGIGSKTKTYSFSSKIHYDNVQIGGSALMSVMGLELGYSRPVTDTIIGEGKVKSQQKTFVDDANNDSSYSEVTLGGKKAVTDSKDLISGELLLSTERATDAVTIDRDITGVKAGYSWVYSDTLTFNGSLNYKMIGYTRESLDQDLQFTKRADTQMTLTLGNVYKLDKSKMVNGSLVYIDNASSHTAFDYSKMLAGVNLLILF